MDVALRRDYESRVVLFSVIFSYNSEIDYWEWSCEDIWL